MNLPADAEIIPERAIFTSGQANYEFDRDDPETYNKSTSITVFDSLGNASIATIYYYKTQNATVTDPTNKWQTRIFIGDREIEPALLKAKNDKNEVLYINKFGQLSADPAAVDPTFNPNAAHPKYALDEQKSQVASQAGAWTGGFMQNGADFGSTDLIPISVTGLSETADAALSVADPTRNTIAENGALSGQDLFRVSVDGSNFVDVSLDLDATESSQLNGAGLANAITLALNDQFGDEKFFDFSSPSDRAFRITTIDENAVETSHVIKIAIPANKTATTMLPSDIVDAINLAMASTVVVAADPAATPPVAEVTLADQMTVSYNIRERAIQFKPSGSDFDDDISQIRVTGWNLANPDAAPGDAGELDGSAAENLVLGFGATSETISVGASVTLGAFLSDALVPNGDFRLDPDQQRSGIKVEYLRDERRFVFKSGTTGEASTIDIQPLYRYLDNDGNPTGDVVPVELVNDLLQANPLDIGLANVRAGQVLGFAEEVADEILVSSGTGLPGVPAITTGSRTGVDTSGTFRSPFRTTSFPSRWMEWTGKLLFPLALTPAIPLPRRCRIG